MMKTILSLPKYTSWMVLITCVNTFLSGTAGTLTYPIVDTGQTKSYNASIEISVPIPGQPFYGQDSQYAGNQPSYTLSSDGRTVLDNTTKLTWMRGPNTTMTTPTPADKKTLKQAQAWVITVNSMKYGGFSDWRIPTIKELYSLISFRGTDPSSYTGTNTTVLTPFIDTKYFNFAYGQTNLGERLIDSQYASSNLFAVNGVELLSSKLFGLNLADGRIKGYDLILPDGKSEKTFYVQLVSGQTSYGSNSYTATADGTVNDSATGLMWAKEDSGTAMTWQEALAWVQSKNASNFLGHNDWRLPNAKELHSLVNYANAPDFNGKPAIDTAFFSCSAITNENGESDFPYYWTSTTHTGYSTTGYLGGSGVYIAFGRALGWPTEATKWVDVHGSGSQRSDPKVAPPYSYATTHKITHYGTTYTGYALGPQGDLLRGTNFVRLVRGGTAVATLAAAFTVSTTVPIAGMAVQFRDISAGNPIAWSWNFGDNSTSAVQNPSHTFATSGTFIVTLMVRTAQVSNTTSTKVVVSSAASPLKASFSYLPSAPVSSQSIVFEDTSIGSPTSWLWNFGDNTTSTQQNPSHAYSFIGTFTVTLTVRNSAGSNTSSAKVIVIAASTVLAASFTYDPSIPLMTQAVTFMDTSTGAPTSWSWNLGDNSTSTLQNPSHTYSKSGTFTVSLTVGKSGASNTVKRDLMVAASGSGNNPSFTLAQTISDEAQRTTIAFSGLAMMTGNLESQSFFPPGKVADYTGFQYLRDNDPSDMGHNTSFLTKIANNVIYLLTDSQFAELKTLAVNQVDNINLYGYKRFPLMKAFRRQLTGDIPSGSTGLNLNAVKKASRELYLLDGLISHGRAVLYASIIKSFNSTQTAYLDNMKAKGWASWPTITSDKIDSRMQGLPQGTAVAVMTYASDLFSWYAGSVDADVYFCPERHGTYYGSFYIKDAPAIGHEGYSINEQLTATAGAALSDSSKGYVTAEQAALMASLVEKQRANLYGSSTSSIVKMRTDIATLLRSLWTGTATASEVQTKVLQLSALYGELDGENNYHYATVFAQVYKTLSSSQITKLADLRKSIMSGTYSDGTPFDFSTCTTPFLYSSVISDLDVLSKYISDTDNLFFEP